MSRAARRPADEATNPKTSAVPTAAKQPGVLGPSNPTRDTRLGPTAKRGVSKIKNYNTRRAARLAE